MPAVGRGGPAEAADRQTPPRPEPANPDAADVATPPSGIHIAINATPLGLRDADPLPNTLPPEQHRGYAVQWWALATAVAVIWLVLAWRVGARDGRSTSPCSCLSTASSSCRCWCVQFRSPICR